MKWVRIMMSTFKSCFKEFFGFFFGKRIYRYAAAFSYYVTMSVFPFLILVSIIVAPFEIHLETIPAALENFIPAGIISVLKSHLNYINRNNTDLMMWSAVLFLSTSASGAMRVLMNIMADIHGKSRYSFFVGIFVSLVMALAVLLFIYLSCFIIVMGRWVIELLDEHFVNIAFTDLWIWLRYLILFPIMFLFVVMIYSVTTPKDKKNFRKSVGALAASVVMVITSIGFSWVMSITNRYTLVYGSLASVVILMIWLFACGIILICGNVINVIIDRRKREKYNN